MGNPTPATPAPKPRPDPPAPKPPAPAPTATPAPTPTATPAGGNAVAAGAAKEGDHAGKDKAVVPKPAGVVDLQGKAKFEPSPELAAYIKQGGHKGAPVDVKWGNLAKGGGTIVVAGKGDTFHTVGTQAIPIDHELLAPFGEPHLRLRISQSTPNAITGYAAPKAALEGLEQIEKLIRGNSAALGLVGFDLGKLNFENKIDAGAFTFGTKKPIDVKLGGWVNVSLDLGLTNDVVRFSATGKVSVRGLAEGELRMARDAKGVVTGQVEIAINLAKFSGKALAKYENGDVSVQGTVSYATEKLKGSLSLIVAPMAEAEKAARAQINPENLLPESAGDAPTEDGKPAKGEKGEKGVAGWGELDFAFTDWFTGKAKVVYGPRGYITIFGEIAPPKSVELMKERVWNTRLFGLDVTARYGLPYVADIHVGISVALGATARIGPAVLTDMSIKGTYSTDPAVLNEFAISGAFRISAYAGLNLRFEGKAGLTILGHDIDIGAGITGKAGVKGYAEARPTLGYREKADPAAGKKGEYYLKGHLEIAAQPFVGLEGDLFVRLDSPWWSPAPDKTWTWPLFSLEYPLPGEFGIGADIDYVIGSDQFPDIKWGKADFDASKFTDSLMDDKIPAKKVGGDVAKPGSWKGEAPKPPTAPPAPPSDDRKAPGAAPPRAGSPAPTGGKGGGQTPELAANVPASPAAAKAFADGMKALGDLHEIAERDPETKPEIDSHLDAIKKKFGFTRLTPSLDGDYWVIDAALNPNNKNSPKKATIKADKRPPNEVKAEADADARLHDRKGWVAQYGEQKKVTGDGSVDRDHQPSKAAIKAAADIEVRRLVAAREISTPNAKQRGDIHSRIDRRALSVVVDKEVHKAGPTYGSKNDAAKITADADKLGAAATRDADAMLANAARLDPDNMARYREGAATVRRQSHDGIMHWVVEIIHDVMNEE